MGNPKKTKEADQDESEKTIQESNRMKLKLTVTDKTVQATDMIARQIQIKKDGKYIHFFKMNQ